MKYIKKFNEKREVLAPIGKFTKSPHPKHYTHDLFDKIIDTLRTERPIIEKDKNIIKDSELNNSSYITKVVIDGEEFNIELYTNRLRNKLIINDYQINYRIYDFINILRSLS